MEFGKVERCVEALKADHARQSGFLSAEDAARVIDRRGLKSDEAAEVWRRLDDLSLLALPPEAAAESVEAVTLDADAASTEADVDLLGLFIGDIRGVASLSETEVSQLAYLIRAGNQAVEAVQTDSATEGELASVIRAGRQARDKFVRANIRLVIYFAKEYFTLPGANKLDLIQDGVIGLMKAVDRFEPALGFRFATYAVWWIRQSIRVGIATREGVLQMPLKIAGKLRRMTAKRKRFQIEYGRSPTLLELARELEVDAGELQFLQQWEIVAVSSLDDPAPGTYDRTVGDAIRDSSSPNPEERLARTELITNIQKNLAEMPDRDRAIVQRRFGFESGEESTLQEIGDEFGLSRERVRQILEKAVESFRKMPAWRDLQ